MKIMVHCQEKYSEAEFLSFRVNNLEVVRKIFRVLIVIAGLAVGISLIERSWNQFSRKPETTALERVPSEAAMNSFRAVFVTVPSIEVGKKIAHGLVSSKLAACVNIIPQITSVYEWEDKVQEDSELLLMIKTKSQNFEELETFVKANHPYEVPEVIAVPIEQGSQQYLDWVAKGSDFKK